MMTEASCEPELCLYLIVFVWIYDEMYAYDCKNFIKNYLKGFLILWSNCTIFTISFFDPVTDLKIFSISLFIFLAKIKINLLQQNHF